MLVFTIVVALILFSIYYYFNIRKDDYDASIIEGSDFSNKGVYIITHETETQVSKKYFIGNIDDYKFDAKNNFVHMKVEGITKASFSSDSIKFLVIIK